MSDPLGNELEPSIAKLKPAAELTLLGEERNSIGAMTIDVVTHEPLLGSVSLTGDVEFRFDSPLLVDPSTDAEAVGENQLRITIEAERTVARLITLSTEAEDPNLLPMDQAELPSADEIQPLEAVPPAPHEPVIVPPTIKPPPVDLAGVLPFVQKRRLGQYQELLAEINRLELDVARLGQLYDAWLRQSEDPQLGTVANTTRRLRELAAREELDTKRQTLADLNEQAAYMEARHPGLTHGGTTRDRGQH